MNSSISKSVFYSLHLINTRSWNYSCTSSWWWVSTPETCRAAYRNVINSISRILLESYLIRFTMHGPLNIKAELHWDSPYLFVGHLTTPLSLNKLCTSPPLKMEAVRSSESLAFVCQTIWRPISDYHKLQRNCILLLMTLFSLMHDHLATLRESCCIHLQDGGKIYETVWCQTLETTIYIFISVTLLVSHMVVQSKANEKVW